MPRSRLRRKRDTYTSPEQKRAAKAAVPSRWIAPVMLTLFVIGLIWIVAWYIAGTSLPVLSGLGAWNLLIGFGFIFAGLMVATRWR